jgi:hypothetical protein
MRWLSVCVFTMILMALSGCDSGASTDVPPASAAPPPSPMKVVLEQIAETGEIGGSGMNFVDEMAKLKAADPAKAGKIEKDLEELIKLTDPTAIKAKAKQIAAEL